MHTFRPEQFGLDSEPDAELWLPDEDATRRLGALLADALRDGGFVGLVGDLGAGKTTLTQGLVEAVSGDEASSPTYTLLNEYTTDPPIYHFDLYRLETVADLETVAYWDYAEDPEAIVLVEWLDRIPQAWGGQGIVVVLEHRPDGRRVRVWDRDGRVCGAIRADGSFDWA